MRWAHSAVDYLAAAVGRVGGAGQGAVGDRVEWEIPIVLGVMEAMVCVCLLHLVTGVDVPTQLPTHSSPHADPPQRSSLSHSSHPHSSLPHSSRHIYTGVNVKPYTFQYNNSNVGTHNIAIRVTLG